MAEEWARPIDARTRYCAVLGHPIAHSASPAMHNAALSKLGLNWRYLAFDARPEDLSAVLEGARRLHFLGLNLTVPHKLIAVPLVDALDESAREWGAVNTIRFEGRTPEGGWAALREFEDFPREIRAHGFNTDADAIARSLREDLDFEPRGRSVLLLGAGGAGRVAALKLAASGVAKLHLLNRTRAKAEEVERAVRSRFPGVATDLDYPRGEIDLILNATSLGLRESDPSPLPDSFPLEQAAAVYDMIYRPARTRLLLAAAAAGCRHANGLGMLLYQGAAALELWCGQPVPIAEMRQALSEQVYGQHI